MQIVLASYDDGYAEGLMIGKRHFNAEKFGAFNVINAIEDGKIEEAHDELIRMLIRMQISPVFWPSAHYSIICVINECIYRLLLAVDHENVVDYEWIGYNGEVKTGRFTA